MPPANSQAQIPQPDYTIDYCGLDGQIKPSTSDAAQAEATRASRMQILSANWSSQCDDPRLAKAIPLNPWVAGPTETQLHPVSRTTAVDSGWAQLKSDWLSKTYDGPNGARALLMKLKTTMSYNGQLVNEINEFIAASDGVKVPGRLRNDLARERCVQAATDLKADLATMTQEAAGKELSAVTLFLDGTLVSGGPHPNASAADMRTIGRCWNIIGEMTAVARSSQLCAQQKSVLGSGFQACVQTPTEHAQNQDTIPRFARDCQKIAWRLAVASDPMLAMNAKQLLGAGQQICGKRRIECNYASGRACSDPDPAKNATACPQSVKDCDSADRGCVRVITLLGKVCQHDYTPEDLANGASDQLCHEPFNP
jgi:hypothetical protein